MLSFAEEIYLLALDEEKGKFDIPSKETVFDNVIIGAVLAELSFLNKIDNDQDLVYINDQTMPGSPVLDYVLDYMIKMNMDKYKIYDCIRILAPKAEEIEKKITDELVSKKVLKKVNRKFLWFSGSPRYPVIDNHEIKDVETRLREIVLGDEIPAPRDAILIGLVNFCGLFGEILSSKELKRCRERIDTISKFELINGKILRQIEHVKNEQ
ncbi:MAG: hypothetical protein A2020_02390 [Lentisphaerae bacterium GWF2_45_14]|nr:MAG: hypothetical protein A2020_02390 [Lentisphaerae bacterium GWF2_45_14]